MGRSPSNSRSPSRSRDNSRDRSRSRSSSQTPDFRRERTASRSRSPRARHGGGGSRHGGGGGSSNARRENPPPSKCLGVFNLSSYTTEKDLRDVFGEFGEIDKCELVYDRPSGHSRGFGFIYYARLEDASAARAKLCDSDLDGHKIRVDYSFTKRGHSPTPGHYMGERRGGHGGGFGGDRHSDKRSGGDRYGGGGRRSPDRRSSFGGGYRGNGYDRNGGSSSSGRGSRRDDSGADRRPYDPNFRRRVDSYASGSTSGRRRSSERY